MGFWQTPFGIFIVGLIVQLIIVALPATFFLGRIYERFRKLGNDDILMAADIGKLSVRTNNLRDGLVAVAYFLDTKHTNPHPDPRIRKIIEGLVNWEQDRSGAIPSPVIGD